MPPSRTDLDRYVMHLNHALAMESALSGYLDKRAAAAHQPELKQRLHAHRDETVRHRESVRELIVALRGEPTLTSASVQAPITRSLAGRMLTALESEAEDRLLEDMLTLYAVERYEDALYSALALAARNLGYTDHAARFDAIRAEENSTADFLAHHLPAVVREAFPPEAQAA
jgi:ferritin-like metal-binding protein YciE